jgi:hypothetical protein
MLLFRPVGRVELELIEKTNYIIGKIEVAKAFE